MLTIYSIYKLQLSLYMFKQMKNLLPGANPFDFNKLTHKHDTRHKSVLHMSHYRTVLRQSTVQFQRPITYVTHCLNIYWINLHWIVLKKVLKGFLSVKFLFWFSLTLFCIIVMFSNVIVLFNLLFVLKLHGGRNLWTRIGNRVLNPFIWKIITLLSPAD